MNACDFKRCLQSNEGEGITGRKAGAGRESWRDLAGSAPAPGLSGQGRQFPGSGAGGGRGRGEMRDGVGGIMRKSKSWLVLGELVFNQGRGIFVSRRWGPSGFQWGALVSGMVLVGVWWAD